MVKVNNWSPTLLTEQMQKSGIPAAVAYGLTISPEMEKPTTRAFTLSV